MRLLRQVESERSEVEGERGEGEATTVQRNKGE
jgi:hypothetical protein